MRTDQIIYEFSDPVVEKMEALCCYPSLMHNMETEIYRRYPVTGVYEDCMHIEPRVGYGAEYQRIVREVLSIIDNYYRKTLNY